MSGCRPWEPESSAVADDTTPVVPHSEVPDWAGRFGVLAGITERGTGESPFDLSLTGDAPVAEVLGRWQALQGMTGCPTVVASRQVHGREVAWHPALRPGLLLLDGLDGHATDAPGVLLAVTVADCIPVYLVDPVARAIALLHAGWRGTAAGVLSAGIEALSLAAGSSVGNVVMHVGPGICGRCYEVGSEVPVALDIPLDGPGPFRVDLRESLIRQAARMGIGEVSRSQFCSAEEPGRFFSHRASGGRAGRMVAYLALQA